jgi:hypothetical protein
MDECYLKALLGCVRRFAEPGAFVVAPGDGRSSATTFPIEVIGPRATFPEPHRWNTSCSTAARHTRQLPATGSKLLILSVDKRSLGCWNHGPEVEQQFQ